MLTSASVKWGTTKPNEEQLVRETRNKTEDDEQSHISRIMSLRFIWCRQVFSNLQNRNIIQLSHLVFKDTSIDTINLSVCKCLYSEYLLVTKPRSFNFINSRALLKTHAACSRFFSSKSKSCWTSRRRNIFNFKSSFAIRLTVLLGIPVSR